ncbi:hypothetical protein Pla52n_37210 [Stieleria varia]|uniref:Uncharacterized protein n=1 Tax=Stieleria varia TaxID=2528005 RepID=A0A5C6AX23_9BACT|nr:hypothetical protein Pla52n_37210 [Stieleria varia]
MRADVSLERLTYKRRPDCRSTFQVDSVPRQTFYHCMTLIYVVGTLPRCADVSLVVWDG